jgi:protein-S-isoprenylcysteine O-methyltransferase
MHIPEIFKLPLAVPFWLVFFLVFVRENRVIRQAFPQASSAQDAGTFRMLMIGSPLALLVGVAASFLPWLPMPFPVATVIVGIVMLLAGGVLRRYCFNTLGTSFTGAVVVKPDQQVIQHGVYRLVRHPSYTAALLMFTGVGVALGNWISVAVLFLAHCVLYGARVSVEEKAFLTTLGEPYREYMSRTKRFIPFVI